ncbi:MAG: hypothetical protein H8E87_05010 [FCB group bacterium]|nr:hypothetical protein [FCB group bacterium]
MLFHKWLLKFYLSIYCISFYIIVNASICRAQGMISESVIKHSGGYKWGEAVSEDAEEAYDNALNDLSRKIQVAINIKLESSKLETDSGYSENAARHIVTYSALYVRNLGKLTFAEGTLTRVLVYISEEDLKASFEASKQRIRDMMSFAGQALEERRIGDALKYYYWSYLLSHTLMDTMNLGLSGQNVMNPQTALPEEIKRIVSRLEVKTVECYPEAGGITAALRFLYDGAEIQSLDFTYFAGDGDDYISMKQGENAYIRLYFGTANVKSSLPLRIEYAYSHEMRTSPEIENLYCIFKEKEFECMVDALLYLSWNVKDTKDTTETKPQILPEPVSHKWPHAVKVLAGIEDRREFFETLDIYDKINRVKYAVKAEQLGILYDVYIAFLDENKVAAVLHFGDEKVVNVKNGKVCADYKKEFAGYRTIWIGVPCDR